MNKNVWKTLFELMSDEDLRYVAKNSGTKVKGFRVVTSAPRAMLVPQLVAPAQLPKVRSFLNQRTEGDEELEAYRSKSKDELLTCLREGRGPFDVLLALLSAQDSDKQMLGEVLVNELELKGELQTLVEAFYAAKREEQQEAAPQQEEPEETAAPTGENDNRIVRKLEKKYDTLKQQYDQLLSEYQEKRKEWEQEVKDLRHQVRDKQIMEGQYKKLQDDHKKCADAQDKLQKDINHKQAMLNNFEKEKAHLQQEKAELEAKVQALMKALEQQGGTQAAKQAVSRAGQQPLVVLIGKPTKNNLELASSAYEIMLLDVEQVEQELEGLLPDASQVWMLTYETPFPKQRKIRQLVGRDRLKEFKDYLGLKSHINR